MVGTLYENNTINFAGNTSFGIKSPRKVDLSNAQMATLENSPAIENNITSEVEAENVINHILGQQMVPFSPGIFLPSLMQ